MIDSAGGRPTAQVQSTALSQCLDRGTTAPVPLDLHTQCHALLNPMRYPATPWSASTTATQAKVASAVKRWMPATSSWETPGDDSSLRRRTSWRSPGRKSRMEMGMYMGAENDGGLDPIVAIAKQRLGWRRPRGRAVAIRPFRCPFTSLVPDH